MLPLTRTKIVLIIVLNILTWNVNSAPTCNNGYLDNILTLGEKTHLDEINTVSERLTYLSKVFKKSEVEINEYYEFTRTQNLELEYTTVSAMYKSKYTDANKQNGFYQLRIHPEHLEVRNAFKGSRDTIHANDMFRRLYRNGNLVKAPRSIAINNVVNPMTEDAIKQAFTNGLKPGHLYGISDVSIKNVLQTPISKMVQNMSTDLGLKIVGVTINNKYSMIKMEFHLSL